MTLLCSELWKDFNHQGWNEYDLSTLPAADLVFLCRVAGIAHTGAREKLIVRLLSCRIVRFELSKFADDPHAVAAAFNRDRLRWMCIQANLWKSGSKPQLAVVLLNWRNRCRMEGQKHLDACISETIKRGFQLLLPFPA
jgi:hypothetical protein